MGNQNKTRAQQAIASTTATKRSTAQDKRAALPDGRVDFHVDKSTDKE